MINRGPAFLSWIAYTIFYYTAGCLGFQFGIWFGGYMDRFL